MRQQEALITLNVKWSCKLFN